MKTIEKESWRKTRMGREGEIDGKDETP